MSEFCLVHDGNSWAPPRDSETAVATHIHGRVAKCLRSDNVRNAPSGLYLASGLVQALELHRIAGAIGVEHRREVLVPMCHLTQQRGILREIRARKFAQV